MACLCVVCRHEAHGSGFKGVGFHSGYNEASIDGSHRACTHFHCAFSARFSLMALRCVPQAIIDGVGCHGSHSAQIPIVDQCPVPTAH
jgi:hypothetical protein